jgi:hypothetical protein
MKITFTNHTIFQESSTIIQRTMDIYVFRAYSLSGKKLYTESTKYKFTAMVVELEKTLLIFDATHVQYGVDITYNTK